MGTRYPADGEKLPRLDESSARRIALGRLAALKERIAAVHLGAKGESAKPEVRARAIQDAVEHGFGRSLLATERKGRVLIHVVALPGEKPGWMDLVAVTHNLRSSNTHFVVFAQLSAHAMARLLERRRGVDLERLLAEELAQSRLGGLVGGRDREEGCGDGPCHGERHIPLQARGGGFACRADLDLRSTAIAVVGTSTALRA